MADESGTLTARMARASFLDFSLYEEVEHDSDAILQALAVVLLVSIASGVGSFLGHVIDADMGEAIGGLISGAIADILGWGLMAFFTYWIGVNIFDGRATWGETLRTLGFAYSPRILLVVSFIPIIGWAIVILVFFWTLLTILVAIRQALDFSFAKAAATGILGWLGAIIITFIMRIVV